jgi:hypothetical protein
MKDFIERKGFLRNTEKRALERKILWIEGELGMPDFDEPPKKKPRKVDKTESLALISMVLMGFIGFYLKSVFIAPFR